MSLRLRLLVALGLIAIVALLVADFATYSALRTSLYNQVDQQLVQHSRAYLVEGQVGFPQNPLTGAPACAPPERGRQQGPFAGGGGPVGALNAEGGLNASGVLYSAVVKQDSSVFSGFECPAYVGSRSYRPQLPSPISGFSTQNDGSQVAYFTTASINSSGPSFRVLAYKAPGGGPVLVLAQPIADQTSTLHTLFVTEFAVTAAALALALVGGWWLVRLGLRPLADVEATAESIAAGDLDQRVPGADRPTEVGRLARALNIMLERIQTAFSARVRSEARLRENEQHLRQFVADASHELRTPIAAVSAYAELFERGAANKPEDLPRVAAGIRAETARMDRLVNDLLTLARLDEGAPMVNVPVELVALTSEAVRAATTVGPEWPVHFSATRPVEVTGDKDRLRQVVDNLLANVRAHTPEGTATTVTVDQVGEEAEILVRDNGPGMPADEAPRIFERFYRADRARARARGGSGLGLSIVEAIVAAHGGTVAATSSPGEGMTVRVRFPAGGASQPETRSPGDVPAPVA